MEIAKLLLKFSYLTPHARAMLGMEGKSDDEIHPTSTSNVQLFASVPLHWVVNVWSVSTVCKVNLHANTRPQQVPSWYQSNAWHVEKEYLWWLLWNTRVYRNCALRLANNKSFAANRFPLDYGTSLQTGRTNIKGLHKNLSQWHSVKNIRCLIDTPSTQFDLFKTLSDSWKCIYRKIQKIFSEHASR